MIGFNEILLIAVVIIILFGATQIPKIARSIGEGIKELKKGLKEAKDTDKEDENKKENNK